MDRHAVDGLERTTTGILNIVVLGRDGDLGGVPTDPVEARLADQLLSHACQETIVDRRNVAQRHMLDTLEDIRRRDLIRVIEFLRHRMSLPATTARTAEKPEPAAWRSYKAPVDEPYVTPPPPHAASLGALGNRAIAFELLALGMMRWRFSAGGSSPSPPCRGSAGQMPGAPIAKRAAH